MLLEGRCVRVLAFCSPLASLGFTLTASRPLLADLALATTTFLAKRLPFVFAIRSPNFVSSPPVRQAGLPTQFLVPVFKLLIFQVKPCQLRCSMGRRRCSRKGFTK